jgi:hypothetical protein
LAIPLARNKKPDLADIAAIRKTENLNQTVFWTPYGVIAPS